MVVLKYNLCFIRQGNNLLMLNRNKSPLCGLWQGVGGKLEVGESPYQSVLREVYEETGLVLGHMRFTGVVTWKVDEEELGGMYVYVAELPEEGLGNDFKAPLETDEGILAWKSIDWITRPDNEGVARHTRHFLKPMLENEQCWDYRCLFRGGMLLSCEPLSLDKSFIDVAAYTNAGISS